MDKIAKTDIYNINTYKIRVIRVDEDEYGFDDVELLLINLKTYLAIGEFTGENQDEYYFTREDFDFY